MTESNKKVFQIITHVMPWEIDYCLLLFDTLSRAKKKTAHVYRIDIALNLSTYQFDWENSKLDKDFFIEKMHYYVKLLEGFDEINLIIYDGDENYGHLDLQKSAIKSDNDYYISITPDQLFDPSILYYFEKSVELINDKYFLITAEIPKFWDTSWDVISNDYFNDDKFKSDGGYDFLSINRYDALDITATDDVNLKQINTIKFAGWLDLYNKNFYEKLVPIPEDWTGYGQWDLYSMLIVSYLKENNFPASISQYKLQNAVTISIEYANWNYGENRSVYKSRLAIKDVPNQREYYDKNMSSFVVNQINKVFEYEYEK